MYQLRMYICDEDELGGKKQMTLAEARAKGVPGLGKGIIPPRGRLNRPKIKVRKPER